MSRILMVADQPTHPVTGGNRMCMLQNAEMLEALGHEVYFLYVDNGNANDCLESMKQYWGERLLYYRPTYFRRIMKKVLCLMRSSLQSTVDYYCPDSLVRYVETLRERFDFKGLFVNYIWLSRLGKCGFEQKALYTHDVFSNRADRITASYKWMSFSESEEGKALRRFDNVLAIQTHEAIFFSYLAPKSRVIPVFSPVTFIRQPVSGKYNVLYFSGGGELNLSGLQWYLENVHPIVERKLIDYKLIVGGGICRSLDVSTLPENVELKGVYADPSDFYRLGDVVVNPVSSGTGLKIKTLEAIAHGKYTVVHPHSAEGLYDGKLIPLEIASEPVGFASAILSAFTDMTMLAHRSDLCCDYIVALNAHIRNTYNSIFS